MASARIERLSGMLDIRGTIATTTSNVKTVYSTNLAQSGSKANAVNGDDGDRVAAAVAALAAGGLPRQRA